MPKLPTALSIWRRALLARPLGLEPPRYAVDVERAIAVAMPDGVRLLTDHYTPRDAGPCPTILIRTPYGRGREVALGGGYALGELPAQRFAERGYHVVVQGVRGCYDSEGDFVPHLNEAADGRATVDWIARQPWFDGRLALWGPSYLGYTAWAAAGGAGPHLSAMLLQVTSAENYTVTHPDGAFGLETRLRWAQGIHTQARLHGRGLGRTLRHRLWGHDEQKLEAAFGHLPLGEADVAAAGEPIPFFRDLLAHPDEDDAFWQARDHRGAVAAVEAPVHLVGGWYDYYLRGLLRDYAALREAGRRPHLTLGPWHHGSAEGLMTGLREGLAWFKAQLKEEGAGLARKPVRLYLMGADEWLEMEDFPPPARATRYYLQSEHGLAAEPPPDDSPPDRYVYDPADPTPAVGGALLALRGAGAQDNAPLEARSDVVCYTTAPLAADLDVIGPARLALYVRSSREHTDFFGRLCDVDPDGTSTNVCDGLLRLEPGGEQPRSDGAVRIEIELWPTAHRFQAGHRLRLQISSGAHPRWSRNLGYGEPLLTAQRLAVAEQTIYHDAARPSALVLPVVDASAFGPGE
ncbi:MAG: CocE/NonD family hydrolase [Anaerolineae bacterium]